MNKNRLNPPPHSILVDLVRHYEAGRHSEAIDLCNTLEKKFAPVSTTWQVKGAIFDQMGKIQDGLRAKETALSLSPQDARSMNNLANSYHRVKLYDKARALYQRAIATDPSFVEPYSGLGSTLNDLGLFRESKEVLGEAVSINPTHKHAIRNLGNALHGLGEHEAAVEMFRRCIALDASFVSAYVNVSATLFALGRFAESVEAGRKAVALDPNSFEGYSNLGNALQEYGSLDEAESVLRKSIALNGQFAAARCNLANVLFEKGVLEEAREYYRSAISLSGTYIDAEFNLGILNLLLGDFSEGYVGYNTRFVAKKNAYLPAAFRNMSALPPQSLTGMRVAVYWEQGFGDTIQFLQLLPMVCERGARVVFFCQPRLMRLVSLFSCPGLDVLPADHYSPDDTYDLYLPLLSVPWALGMSAQGIRSIVPYLHAESERVDRWSKTIDRSRFVVGVCWQGSTAKIDKGRSFALSYFAWLLDDPRVQVVSLHKGVGEDQIPLLKDPTRLTTFGKDFDEGPDAFLDTAAVIKQCDLVLSSDTAVAHLAGAMGVRTWVVLKKIPDWRWGYDGNTSAWYPNMQLFRQTELGNWSGAFDRVRHAFSEVLAGR